MRWQCSRSAATHGGPAAQSGRSRPPPTPWARGSGASSTAGRCGYASIKAGDIEAGVAEMEKAVDWFGRSQLRYTRVVFGARLCEGYLRLGDHERARALLEEFLPISREGGYRHAEGLVERILGEVVARDDGAAAAAHLESAVRIFEEVGAHDELGRALVALAGVRQQTQDLAGARHLLQRALTLFEECGTVDEPARVRALLDCE
jgi:tetratricopeptide (TPR) repeat protein